MKRHYPVIFEWSGKNFSGFAPDIPGCAATGKDLNEIRSSLREALEAHLQWIASDAEDLPLATEQVTVDMSSDAEFPNPKGYYVVVERLNISLPMKKTSATPKRSLRELTAA